MKPLKFKETLIFQKEVKRLSKKYRSLLDDVEKLKEEIQQNPTNEDHLGNNIYKIRFSIASKGKGKSAGGRAITLNCIADLNNPYIVLVFLYDKSEYANIKPDFIKQIIKNFPI